MDGPLVSFALVEGKWRRGGAFWEEGTTPRGRRLPTGIEAIDSIGDGGLLCGGISEIVGEGPSSGGPHPMRSLRPTLKDIWRAEDLKHGRHGTCLKIAGCVISRQRPETAKGFLFMSLEDETGVCNAVVSPRVFQANRHTIIHEHYLIITGSLQNIDGVICVKARHFEALVEADLPEGKSYDFH